MSENKYIGYPEGFEQLAKDIEMPFDDIAMKKMMLSFLASALING